MLGGLLIHWFGFVQFDSGVDKNREHILSNSEFMVLTRRPLEELREERKQRKEGEERWGGEVRSKGNPGR
jgi:hypothetical protein